NRTCIAEDRATARSTYKLPGGAVRHVGDDQVKCGSAERRTRADCLCRTKRADESKVSEIDVGRYAGSNVCVRYELERRSRAKGVVQCQATAAESRARCVRVVRDGGGAGARSHHEDRPRY